jgi:hypothetical protein
MDKKNKISAAGMAATGAAGATAAVAGETILWAAFSAGRVRHWLGRRRLQHFSHG